MKNTIGNHVSVTLFGESHGPSIGVVLDGLAPGMRVDEEYITAMLAQRRPAGALSTARREPDPFVIESGVWQGYTTGTSVCIRIPNTDTRSGDYADTRWLARPSHADYTAHQKYHGFEDYRGGGHFSGRLTAALVAAGALVMPSLVAKGIAIGTHIQRCAGVADRDFGDIAQDIAALQKLDFGALDAAAAEEMQQRILKAKAEGDSVGGVLETAVIGLEPGLGEPWFDTVEGVLAHALYAIPAVKGVEFGEGFACSDMRGSDANDAFLTSGNEIGTETNHNGGILGGISSGMPLHFRVAVKPTPSIGKEQQSISFSEQKAASLVIHGRHDPCILPRAVPCIEAVTAIALTDLLIK